MLWLYGPEKLIPGLLRNGSQASHGNVTVASCIENSFHKSIYNTHLDCWPCLEKRVDKNNEPQMERKITLKTTMNLVTSCLMTLAKILAKILTKILTKRHVGSGNEIARDSSPRILWRFCLKCSRASVRSNHRHKIRF